MYYRLTSQFIIDGALARLHRLQKLNLVRTYVDDSGKKIRINYTCTLLSVYT